MEKKGGRRRKRGRKRRMRKKKRSRRGVVIGVQKGRVKIPDIVTQRF